MMKFSKLTEKLLHIFLCCLS